MKSHKEYKSALSVQQGIEQPSQINEEAVSKIRTHKTRLLTTQEYLDGIRSGNRTILSKAITLIESSLPAHQEKAQEIIAECLKVKSEVGGRRSEVGGQRSEAGHPASSIQHLALSIRIGITGVPGVGKSTFIEALGKNLTSQGYKLAVLAIDPSSTKSKGSILGDKTRMEELANDPNAFVRPSPSAGSLGGVARKTRETIILCEAAGFNVIFVETVGVGQSETAVHSMVDFFLLLMLAGAGDELQGIKRGIIEMADAIIINKADGQNISMANVAKTQYSGALHLFPPSDSGWIPVVDTCSSRTKEGIANAWDIITRYETLTRKSGYFLKKRMDRDRQVLYESIEESLKSKFFSRKDIHQLLRKFEEEILSGKVSPYLAANQLIRKYFEGLK
jgi:LAO/AO transport system kinase